MAVTPLDIVCLEVPGGTDFVAVEGASAGTAASIQTSPAPFAFQTESKVLQLLQSKTDSHWLGNAHPFTDGDAFTFSTYVEFSRVGWPATNNITPVRFVTSGRDQHCSLVIVPNGSAADLQICDMAGVTRHTKADAFPDVNRIYRIDVVARLSSTAGTLILQVVDKVTGNVVSFINVNDIDPANFYDFYAGTGEVAIELGGEGGNTPAIMTETFFSSFFLGEGAATTLVTSEFVGNLYGDFSIFGVSPTKASAAPDCDHLGGAPGVAVNLDTGTWDNLGDGTATTLGEYNFGNEGAIAVEFPGPDPRVLLRSVQIAGSYVFLAQGARFCDIRLITGATDDSGSGFSCHETATITIPATPPRAFKIVNFAGSAFLPKNNERMVIGFHAVGSSQSVVVREAFCFMMFEYPLLGQVSLGKLYTAKGDPKKVVL